MKLFWIKLVNLLLVVSALAGYHVTLSLRAEQEEVARLNAELEQTVIQWEADRKSLAAAAENSAKSSGAEPVKTETETESAGKYRDGVYQGSAQGFGGIVSVEVTVEEGEIADIAVISAKGEDSAYLSMASALLYDILDTQGTEVSTVSGATFSSKGLINAVKAALEQAGVE